MLAISERQEYCIKEVKRLTKDLEIFMPVRLKDVAAAARVSIALVSNYVNGKSTTRMSNATRERIDKALRELNYRPNPLARMLRTGNKNRTVGIITAGLKNEVNLQTVLAFQQHLLERDYNSLIYYTRNELGLLRTGCQEMLCRGCAGVIVHSQKWYVEDLALPQVVVSADLRRETALPEVFCDYRPGVEALLDHLVSLGHQRILFLTYSHNRSCRQEIFAERFGTANMAFVSSNAELTPDKAGEILQQHPGVTAAFCSNDLLALALREALIRRGMKVPEDFSVAGFDNTQLSQFCGLTTVDQAIERRAVSAVNALLNILENRSDPVEHCIPAELILRNSCSHIKK